MQAKQPFTTGAETSGAAPEALIVAVDALLTAFQTRMGGAHHTADQLLALAAKDTQVARHVGKKTLELANGYAKKYKETGRAETTHWFAALSTAVHINKKIGENIPEILIAIRNLGEAHHAGYPENQHVEIATRWTEEINHYYSDKIATAPAGAAGKSNPKQVLP